MGGDGNPGPTSIDWGIGNASVFGTVTDDMVFSTCTGDFMTGSNWKERMRITKDGNVGIGTTTPGAKLQVDGRVRFYNNTEIYVNEINRITSDALYIQGPASGHGNTYICSDGGNVGIGTTSP